MARLPASHNVRRRVLCQVRFLVRKYAERATFIGSQNQGLEKKALCSLCPGAPVPECAPGAPGDWKGASPVGLSLKKARDVRIDRFNPRSALR